ncbi:hypothetical protein IFO69_17960 [Echinicola sp. CAU 1574]|uniref:Dockerin domain-containing protein n=1 Tax=Echinicola arenosa TaxID=2774144 RepID=A0ABR9APZ2_9BACT|nr:dockerin type I domain-containing protein [Echinicola arenosa]MBD8490644.1 hypothetical protein [Echinicola arenosa]
MKSYIANLVTVLLLFSCEGGNQREQSNITISEETLVNHVPVSEPGTALKNLPANFTPLFIMGDINEDMKVDTDDINTINNMLNSGSIDQIPCAIAADINANGEINDEDRSLLASFLEKSQGDEFTLYSQPYFSCSFSNFWIAANYLDLQNGHFQFFIPNYEELDISIYSTYKEYPIEVGQSEAVFDIHLPPDLDMEYFDLRLKVGLKNNYHLYLPIGYLDKETEAVEDSSIVITPPTPPSPLECPQRGGGCEALVIDYSKKVWFEFDADPMADELPTLGCNLTHITPYMKEIPTPTVVRGFTIYSPSQASITAARTHNRNEHTAVNNAINTHRLAIGAGKELVMEIVRGHGSPCPGVFGAQAGPGVLRNGFHTGNYNALKRKTCAWFTTEITCYSGCTPRIIDGLENLGRAARATVTTKNIAFHAPYECTTSFAASDANSTISNGACGTFASSIGTILHNEVLLRNQDIQNGTPPADYTRLINVLRNPLTTNPPGRYIDHGYMFCQPNHSHFKTGI